MAQQTAVEWLVDQLYKKQKYYSGETVLLFEKAKQMEKKQILDAFTNGDYQAFESEAEQYIVYRV